MFILDTKRSPSPMDSSVCSTCLIYFQKALNSPIGEAILSYIKALNPPLPKEYNILTIFENLRQNKLYRTPEEWLSDLEDNVERSVRFFGEFSDIAIAIQSLQHSLVLSTKHLLKGDNEKWQSACQKLNSEIISYLKNAPNNELAFKELVGQSPQASLNFEPFIPSALTLQNEKIDLNELKTRISLLPTDEDHQNLRRIVSHYEPEYSNASGIIPCEIRHFHPYSLHLIKEYVNKHAPPLPPQPVASNAALNNPKNITAAAAASIPRMKSTPLPTNPVDFAKRPPPIKANQTNFTNLQPNSATSNFTPMSSNLNLSQTNTLNSNTAIASKAPSASAPSNSITPKSNTIKTTPTTTTTTTTTTAVTTNNLSISNTSNKASNIANSANGVSVVNQPKSVANPQSLNSTPSSSLLASSLAAASILTSASSSLMTQSVENKGDVSLNNAFQAQIKNLPSPSSIAATSPFLKINSPSPPEMKSVWDISDNSANTTTETSRTESIENLDTVSDARLPDQSEK